MGTGSSPLTRGKHVDGPAGRDVGGLIPAHAGKTRPAPPSACAQGAHPRSRGENIQTCVQVAADLGSSPLTRGKQNMTRATRWRLGLIPAHAGKTRRLILTSSVKWAHPRSRGENALPSPSALADKGSSPLTRGKRPRTHLWDSPMWLIPAHAGKTPLWWTRRGVSRAHPRSRGENHDLFSLVIVDRGSSPLTRGKRWVSSV